MSLRNCEVGQELALIYFHHALEYHEAENLEPQNFWRAMCPSRTARSGEGVEYVTAIFFTLKFALP